MSGAIRVRGELYVTLEAVAEAYEVQAVWLRRAYDSGLFGTGVESGASVSIAAVHLDRVAAVVRMHRALGLDLEMIVLALED